jgi:hypothetical protein
MKKVVLVEVGSEGDGRCGCRGKGFEDWIGEPQGAWLSRSVEVVSTQTPGSWEMGAQATRALVVRKRPVLYRHKIGCDGINRSGEARDVAGELV